MVGRGWIRKRRDLLDGNLKVRYHPQTSCPLGTDWRGGRTYGSSGVRKLCIGRSDRRWNLDVLLVLVRGDGLNICLVCHDWRV